MKKILYTKFNSTRRPEFQLSTSIVEENGIKYVEKKAIQPIANQHMVDMVQKRVKLETLYDEMKVVDCEVKGDRIIFPFVKGKGLLSNVDFQHDKTEDIIEKINLAWNKVACFKEPCYVPFQMSDGYKKIFGNYNWDENTHALCPANVDGIIGNFIELEDGSICAIDYEWVFDFPIPVNYVKYRALFYLYLENESNLKLKFSQEEFLQKFGYTEQEIRVYSEMENTFQQYVRGENMAYAYPDRYSKNIITLNQLQDAYDTLPNLLREVEKVKEESKEILEEKLKEKDEHIDALENRIEFAFEELDRQHAYIEKLRKMIKDPVYGMTIVAGKIKKKVMRKISKGSIEKKTLEYREKYKELISEKTGEYATWIEKIERVDLCDKKFDWNPKISFIIGVKKLEEGKLQSTIESICKQIYFNWNIYILVGAKEKRNVQELIKPYTKRCEINVVNETFDAGLFSGEFIAFIDLGDRLGSNALYEMVNVLNHNDQLDFIYSDEDAIDEDTQERVNPFFKPNWSPDTLMSWWYTGHLAVYRKEIVDKLKKTIYESNHEFEYDMVLQLTEMTNNIYHLDKILYHRSEERNFNLENIKKIKKDALLRRNLNAELELIEDMNQYRVNYQVAGNPLVSIIIPSKDNYEVLKVCIDTLTAITRYENYEIILVDNGSSLQNKEKYESYAKEKNIRYIYKEMVFNFSKMCNLGIQEAKGEYFVFLNDDMEIIQEKWLERMIGHASLSHVGAVGAKLLYPGVDIIQHTGVVMYEEGPSHALGHLSDKEIHAFGRNRLEYNWICATAACLAVQADKCRQVGGFNEALEVTYNDVDLCFKLLEAGYYNVVRCDAVLYHHESLSRGDDNMDQKKRQRLLKELKLLKALHPQFDAYDPYYNKNLAQRALDFDCDYTRCQCNRIKKKLEEIPLSKAMRCHVDYIEDVGSKIYIHGWGFIPERLDNNDMHLRLLLKGEKESYIVETSKVYRPDIAEGYPNQPLIEFTGYQCVIDKKDIEKGTYSVGIIGSDGCKIRKEFGVIVVD